MKITCAFQSAAFSILTFLTFQSVSFAATLAISSGGPGMRMSDNFGIPSDTGGYVILAGTFAVNPFTEPEQAIPELLGSFVEFGRTTSPTFGPTKGLISGVMAGGDPSGALSGKPIYLVVGDKATLQESTSIVVLKSTTGLWNFVDDLNFPAAITTVILGRNAPVSVLGGFLDPLPGAETADVIRPAGWSVPEPGSSLFLLLGGAMLYPRRRK